MTSSQHQPDSSLSSPIKLPVPDHLSLESVVALNEPSLAVCSTEVRQHLRERMSPESIEEEIDAISEVARLREEFGDYNLLGLKATPRGYACVDSGLCLLTWMHEHERERLNQLKIALPTSAEEVLAARARIQERIARRKQAMLDHS